MSTSSYYTVPALDYPIDTGLAVVNWYPIYGKMNLMDLGISHFDVYAQLGYGKTSLLSGITDTYSVGGGVGLWWTQWLASRLEARYQTYQDQVLTGPRQENIVVFTASLGFML